MLFSESGWLPQRTWCCSVWKWWRSPATWFIVEQREELLSPESAMGTLPLEARCGELPALWRICSLGQSWLHCFEAVKLVESDLARAVFHLLAVTLDLLWRSYTIYSLTSIICHWSWLVKELSGKNAFVKFQHVKPGKFQKYDIVDEACQNLRGDCAVR